MRVHVGSHSPARATARILDRHETNTALAAYRDRHPRGWARFKPVLEQTLGAPINDTDAELPLVEWRLD